MLQKNEQHFSAEHQKQKVPRKGNLWHEAQHRSREGHARWLRGRRSPSIRGVGKPGLLAPCFLRGGQLSAASCPHCRPFNSSPYRDTQRQSDASTDLFTAATFASMKAWKDELPSTGGWLRRHGAPVRRNAGWTRKSEAPHILIRTNLQHKPSSEKKGQKSVSYATVCERVSVTMWGGGGVGAMEGRLVTAPPL